MANITVQGIDADTISVGHGVSIGERTRIHAQSVTLGDGVTIGDDVTIACDVLTVGAESRIGHGSRWVSPEIVLGPRCRIGAGFSAEVNESIVLGRLCDIGQSVRIVAHRVEAGDHLWLTDAVLVGGGGARGPRSRLTLGDRCAVMDRCFINLSDRVTIGSDTALSNGVTLLTHSLWQPVLDGGTAQFAPIQIGSRCILYVNAVVAPGVTIGDDVTVGAGALVLQPVPDASTALGNPARIMRSTPQVPRALADDRRDAILRDILEAWAETLEVKGMSARFDARTWSVTASSRQLADTVRYMPLSAPSSSAPDASVTLAFGPPTPDTTPACHFDLSARTMTGTGSPVAEDLRDFLRRRTIRIYTDRPFQPLPPASLDRLRARLRPID